jgi:hypothetical protein
MKPGRLKGMAHHLALQEMQVPARLIKKTIPVPGRGAKIPKMCRYKEQDPKSKESRPEVDRRPHPGRYLARRWRKRQEQEKHAKQPADWVG